VIRKDPRFTSLADKESTMSGDRPTVGQIHIAKEISAPQLVHRDGSTQLWMAFVADPDAIPVGLMEERTP
jgi:hypothetical protein